MPSVNSRLLTPRQNSQTVLSQGSPQNIEWTKEMIISFCYLKQALNSALALGITEYSSLFHLYVSKDGSTAEGILVQEYSGSYCPVAYLPKSLDP